MVNDRRYKSNDVQEMRYYQMPKALFGNEKYKGLDLAAKAMYSVLRDRQDLSIRNKWQDSDGFVYSMYSVDDLASLLDVTKKTAIKYKAMLVTYGLLTVSKMGNGRADLLYVLKPELPETSSVNITPDQTSVNITPETSVNITPGPVYLLHPNDTDLNDTDLKEKKEEEENNNENRVLLFGDRKELSPTEIWMLQYVTDKTLPLSAAKKIVKKIDLKKIDKTVFFKVIDEGQGRLAKGRIMHLANWIIGALENEQALSDIARQ